MSRFTHISAKKMPMNTIASPIFVPSTPFQTPVWPIESNHR